MADLRRAILVSTITQEADMTDLTITLEESGSKGRYVARIPGSTEEAEMTFSLEY